MSADAGRIGVLDISSHAFGTLLRDKDAILALGVPLLLPMLLADVAVLFLYAQQPLILPVSVAVTAICMMQIAVNLHRHQLLGPSGVAAGPFDFQKRTLRFFGFAIVAWLPTLAGLGLGVIVAWPLIYLQFGPLIAVGVAALVGLTLTGLWVTARLLPGLPRIAIDRSVSLAGCWERTRGFGMRITAILILSEAPFLIANGPLRETFVPQSATAAIVVVVIGLGLELAALAVGVAALCAIYRRLGGTAGTEP